MSKTSLEDAAAFAESQLIHPPYNLTPESPFKFEQTELAAIKKLTIFFKCAVQPLDTQSPQQGNKFMRAEQYTPPVLRLVEKIPRVPNMENKTPPTLRVEPIVTQIHTPA